MKFQNEKCECGLDLSTATPVDEFFNRDEAGKVVAFGVCPNCGRNNPMIEVEEPKPEALKSETPRRRRAPEAPPES